MKFVRAALAAASVATIAVASSASAAPILIDYLTNTPLAGQMYTTFDARTLGSMTQVTDKAGITVSFTGNGAFVQGSSGTSYQAPVVSNGNGANFASTTYGAQANGVDTTPYVSTGYGSARLQFAAPTNYFGLLWGSIDSFNIISFASADGTTQTLTASQVFGGNLAAFTGTSRYVNFSSTSGFTSVTASSTQNSFEFDNVATAVPEPAAWLMMIAGFGLVGYTMRRRKAAAQLSYAG